MLINLQEIENASNSEITQAIGVLRIEQARRNGKKPGRQPKQPSYQCPHCKHWFNWTENRAHSRRVCQRGGYSR